MKNKRYIGCSGFAQGYWKGFFYPEDLPSKDYLAFYSEHLSAVEINSTFYRKPMVKTLAKWYDSTGTEFRFFIKIPKAITHLKKLTEVKQEVSLFCEYISGGLEEKLAGFLFQLPPSFQFTPENLEKVLNAGDRNYMNVFEFRHESWWNSEVQEALKKNAIIFAGVSFPKNIPDDVVINNDNTLYYRLHGVPQLFKSEYSESELEDLAKKIENFKGTSYLFFNNTFGVAGIKNALFLDKALNKS
ncbi:DUF72 domain-containing protein [Kaistella carnis]|uniref:DUF72 domain-containing protein n=1 Tax=Kaistella carnis TaxID=1241979 RepID=UPI00289DE3F3|nr:DUF72 domain-containing protein [Kaistella carnis]